MDIFGFLIIILVASAVLYTTFRALGYIKPPEKVVKEVLESDSEVEEKAKKLVLNYIKTNKQVSNEMKDIVDYQLEEDPKAAFHEISEKLFTQQHELRKFNKTMVGLYKNLKNQRAN